MSITFQVLGAAGRDNALLAQVTSGRSVERLLFDCGDGCLADLPLSEIQAIDQLFFSHLHMDHVGGFDAFFRCTFSRTSRPNQIWGPPGTARIMQHRLQGYLWNLHEQMSATWRVADVGPDAIHTARLELREAFAVAHDEGARPRGAAIWEGAGCSVEAVTMDHRTPSLAYIVRERPRRNIDTARLAALGLRPGPWLQQLREPAQGDEQLVVDGAARSLAELRAALLVETPGDAIAYLTDFRLDGPALERLAGALRGCRAIICEGQYRHADSALAERNYHMTSTQAATLARRAQVGELVLFHLSDRYTRAEWAEMLGEARAIFPQTSCPPQWGLDGGGA